jgi:hypothetical protein
MHRQIALKVRININKNSVWLFFWLSYQLKMLIFLSFLAIFTLNMHKIYTLNKTIFLRIYYNIRYSCDFELPERY